MNIVDIQALQLEASILDQDCIKIQQQIDAVDFKTCDRLWFSKAKAALKIKRRQFNQINLDISVAKRAHRVAESQENSKRFDFLFRQEAKRILSDDLYAEILASTKECDASPRPTESEPTRELA